MYNSRKAAIAALAMTCAAAAAQQTAPPARVAPRGPAPATPVAADYLVAVNETPGMVIVELVPQGKNPQRGEHACLAPKTSVRWPAMNPAAPTMIRMKMISGACNGAHRVDCERAIPYAAGMRRVLLRGEGKGCGVFPMKDEAPAEPRGLKTGAAGNQLCGPSNVWAPLTFTNRYARNAVWVTITNKNRSSNMPDPQRAGCWLPNETRLACIDPTTIELMAEVEDGPVCAAHLRVLCKTTHETRLEPQPRQPPAGAFVHIRDDCKWTEIAYGRSP